MVDSSLWYSGMIGSSLRYSGMVDIQTT
jgi:hypothetical protein